MADGHTGAGSFSFKRGIDGVGIALRLLGHEGDCVEEYKLLS